MTVRPLSEPDLDAWIAIRRASFGSPRDPDDAEARSSLRSRLPYARGVDEAGELVAACCWYPYPAWVGGVRVPTGALAAVVSDPPRRRRGHVRTLILDGLAELRDAGVGWALEHPFDPRFYARMGFRAFPAAVTLELPIERLPGDAREVAFASVEPDDPELRAIRARFAASHGFAFDRDDPPVPRLEGRPPLPTRWSRLFEPPEPNATPGTAYRTDGGYAIVATEGFGADGILHVVDAAWSDAGARARVLAMLTAWRGQVAAVRIDLPLHDRLALANAPRYARARPVLQGRIVDLPSALRPLRARPEHAGDALLLRVVDPVCAWNDGTWRIEPSADGVRIEGSAEPAPTTVAADALAALLAGVPAAALRAAGDVDGPLAPLHALASLTADQPVFLGRADYF